MPGRLASSAAEAVLTLTLLPPISDPEGAATAPVPRSTSPQRNPTAALLNRLMPTSSLRWRLCGRRMGASDRKARSSVARLGFPRVRVSPKVLLNRGPRRSVTPAGATFPFESACVTRLASRRRALHGVELSLARALRSGRRSRWFKSSHPDHLAGCTGLEVKIRVRRASRRLGAAGAHALPLVFAGLAHAAPPKAAPAPPAPAAAPAPAPTWIADELRILRSEPDTCNQRADGAAADVAALRAEIGKLANVQGETERRIASTPPGGEGSPVAPPDRGGNGGVAAPAVFLALGAALGWVGSRLTQRWRDRRQRIRV